MTDRKLLAFYGLKYNPFLPAVPVEDLWLPPGADAFLFRVETLVVPSRRFRPVQGCGYLTVDAQYPPSSSQQMQPFKPATAVARSGRATWDRSWEKRAVRDNRARRDGRRGRLAREVVGAALRAGHRRARDARPRGRRRGRRT